jgi:hypothetical protein
MIKVTNRTAGTLTVNCINKQISAGHSIMIDLDVIPEEVSYLSSYAMVTVEVMVDTPKAEDLKTKKNKFKED